MAKHHNNKSDKDEEKQKQSSHHRNSNRMRTARRYVIGTIIGIIIIVFFILLLKSAKVDTTGLPVLGLTTPSTIDHVKGAQQSQHVFIEYSDFQCPACGSYYPIAKQFVEDYSDEVKFIYRHLPLKNIHKNANIAAIASEAAAKQGMFWEMHDTLFEKQDEWGTLGSPKTIFASYAKELGMNVDQFKIDMADDAAAAIVEHQYQSAVKFGVGSTPTFYYNGRKVQPRNYDDFVALIS
ncbi:MAG: protein-disulfide isomerase [Candidatus Woesearchaeota archaeon]|jgi:protein-disulfide isomerase